MDLVSEEPALLGPGNDASTRFISQSLYKIKESTTGVPERTPSPGDSQSHYYGYPRISNHHLVDRSNRREGSTSDQSEWEAPTIIRTRLPTPLQTHSFESGSVRISTCSCPSTPGHQSTEYLPGKDWANIVRSAFRTKPIKVTIGPESIHRIIGEANTLRKQNPWGKPPVNKEAVKAIINWARLNKNEQSI